MQHDGSNSARARSARIRATHDDEATRLDSMRRNGEELRSHPSRMARVAAVLGRARRWNVDPLPALDAQPEGELLIGPRPHE
jgi:hypothetical protein